ncbi:STAS domain-containing protein [Streptomyces kanamyceticus]|uniref:Anti-sigma factor antagonist n=1 Tax=Streptomyces kanamyceticus TaxID=1967 RepID=A0A5J6GNS8_STRKN|nr:STAS domain-containing protein [Streptomyces kanamyceticus]QEU96052.1 anti-sigma factor antagonist [Streptomyces kanamyceticus]
MLQTELGKYEPEGPGPPPSVYGLDGAIVVELHGDVDLVAYQQTVSLMDAAASGAELLVVIDLSQVTFFDCSGISLLMRTRRRVRGRGGDLRVVCTDPLTLRMLRITRLTPLLCPVPSLGAALRGPFGEN